MENKKLEQAVGHLLHQLTEGKGVHLDPKVKEDVLKKTVKMLEEEQKLK